ncbi:hypothetical protein BhaS171_00046 [Bacillus phage vB_BhaS-171]|uniref:hypothetical protein n=1 Tax=Bacillus phage vB_BhaS-171 TaxID=1775140 RepID=UPI0007449B05|nr:hypothetical protein BH781_gp46 [Bacillus phage vB_BhaS-171]ALY08102.1 hypothetical protein BhaS171_00046 [Bacillus phage vB_BhaS-171]
MTQFKELIETVQMTTGLSKRDIQRHLDVSEHSMFIWQRSGPPSSKMPLIMSKLKELIHTPKTINVSAYYSFRRRGMFDYQIAQKWGICKSSLRKWKRDHSIGRRGA